MARLRQLQRRPADPRRPALDDDDARRLRRRRPDRRLLGRVHGRRRRGAPLLRLHGDLRLLDAAPRPGREPAAPARRLGPRRPLVVPPDRLLARAAGRDRGREEGLRHERLRRRDDGARVLPAHPAHALAELRDGLRARARPRVEPLAREPRRARPARRRRGQVGPAPAANVASRRDGGPDAGERADPRGDDGDRGRLPDRPHAFALRGRAARRGARRRPRRRDAPARRADRPGPDGHQARHRLLDDVADRLHVPRRGARRLRERDVPPDDARLLQGAALHGGRDRHPRARGRAGHAKHGRSARPDAPDVPRVPRRRARSRRRTAVRRLLLQGLDPRGRDARRLVRLPALGRRARGHVPHRPLHVPDAVHRVRRRALAVRPRAPDPPPPPGSRAPRGGAVLDDRDGDDPRRPVRDRRVDPVRAALDPGDALARRRRADAPARRRDELAGGDLERPRGRARPRRRHRCVARLLTPTARDAEARLRAAAPRAQALLRRGVRPRVLPPGRPDGPLLRRRRGRARRRRLDHRPDARRP